MRGRFITFEGGEGSGKSTQARLLASHLKTLGLGILETREPGGSPFAERVRALILDPDIPPHGPMAEALLFYAARSDHLATTIKPRLDAGDWVVCDRFSDSTRVYQGVVGGLAGATIATLEQLVVGDCRPDLTVLLDLAPEVGLARADARRRAGTTGEPVASDAYEARDIAFHSRLRAGFLQLAGAEPERFAVVDATLAPDALAERVRELVASRLDVDRLDAGHLDAGKLGSG